MKGVWLACKPFDMSFDAKHQCEPHINANYKLQTEVYMVTATSNGYFRSKIREIKRHTGKYLMISPFFAFFTVFTIIPVIAAITLGFTDFNLLEIPSFVGLSNYLKLLLDDSIFITSVINTMLFALITGPLSFILCFIMAWFVNELSPKFRTAMTFLFYAPVLSGNIYMLWQFIFSGDIYGWINGVLMSFGITQEPIMWLRDPRYMLGVIMLVQLWMSLGTSFLAFIAGLQSVDRNLYEAAAVDGVRNRWQELFYVTLPSMGPQLLFGAVMQISVTFAAGRICIDLAGLPSTDYAASTIVTHAMDYAYLRYEMGYACAIATVLFMMMLTINKYIRNKLRKYI